MLARSARAAPPGGSSLPSASRSLAPSPCRSSGAAVGVGAAADAQNDLPAPGVQRCPDEFAGAQARGCLGSGRIGAAGQDGQAGGRRHLDDCLPPADRELGRERLPGGAADHGAPAGEAGADGGIEGAFAAVGHGNPEDLQVACRRPTCSPVSRCRATSGAESEPLNLSGAITMRMAVPVFLALRLRAAGPGWRWGRRLRSRPAPRTR